MIRLIIAATAFVLSFSIHQSWAQPLTCTFDGGDVQIKRAQSPSWASLQSGEQAGLGDSITFKTSEGALITLSENAAIVVKDTATLKVGGTAESFLINLDHGEIFLSRNESETPTPVWIMAKSCSFSPVGTKAAVKITPEGNPSVAVVEGLMKVTDPAGRSLDVSKGSFATFDNADRSFRQGKLPNQAIERINSWSEKNLDKQDNQVAMNRPEAEENDSEPKNTESEAAVEEEVVGSSSDKVMQMQEPESDKKAEEQPKRVEKPQPEKQNVSHSPAPQAASNEQPSVKEPAEQTKSKQSETTSVPASDNVGSTPARSPEGPTYAVNAGVVTVDDEQWTRVAFMVDVPIWRFGLGLDIELFMDSEGGFSNKGWEFSKDQWSETLLRKIRYIRFNHEGDPFFAKFGGLSSVTMGHGFIVDRFSNMLYYPDERQLGLRLDLNDISPIGITLQTMIADVRDFSRDGGILAARLGIRPFKPSEAPILKNMLFAGTIATDINQYAPARDWDYTLHGSEIDRDQDGIPDGNWQEKNYTKLTQGDTLTDEQRANAIAAGNYDTEIEHEDSWAKEKYDQFSIIGGDVSIPIVNTKIFGLDIYGQGAMNLDDDDGNKTRGWGIGAPGVAANIGPLWSRVEYRQVDGSFEPGYFGPYYQEERIRRDNITVKEHLLDELDQDLKGVFGTLGMDIAGVFVLSGTYQRLIGEEDSRGDKALDQRFELTGTVGDMLMQKIPRLNKAEAFLYKKHIQRTVMGFDGIEPQYDNFFQRTPNMYWGYRLGGEIASGASLVWETRYGWAFENGELVENKNVTISAGMAF